MYAAGCGVRNVSLQEALVGQDGWLVQKRRQRLAGVPPESHRVGDEAKLARQPLLVLVQELPVQPFIREANF